MKFVGQDPVRCKMAVDSRSLQQGRNFKFLGSEIYYENEEVFYKK